MAWLWFQNLSQSAWEWLKAVPWKSIALSRNKKFNLRQYYKQNSSAEGWHNRETVKKQIWLNLTEINRNKSKRAAMQINQLVQPACSILIGDFNAKCSKWCSSDKNNIAGLQIDNITTTAGSSQLIKKPTHFINWTSSCIDVIFSSNVSFIRNYGIEQSIYEKCHHSITYGTLDFNVPLRPPYYREIWDYKNAGTEIIQKAISNVDWPKASRNKNQIKVVNHWRIH